MAFQGEVGAIGIADVLGNIAANSLAGTLHVTSERGEAWLAFDGGMIKGYSRGLGKALSGEEVLRLRSSVKEEEVDALAKRKRRTKKGWAEFVEAAGAMKADAFRQLATNELVENAVEVFFWSPAKFEFADGPASDTLFDTDLDVAVDVNSLVMEAARRRDHWELINRVVGSPEDIFIRRRPEPLAKEAPPLQRKIHEACNGSNSVRMLESLTRAPRFAVFDAVAEMVRAGHLRPLTSDEMVRLAEEHSRAARTAEAIRLYRRTLETEHANAGVREKLAETYARHGEPAKAAGEYKLLAHRALEQGDAQAAVGWYRKAMALAPDDYAVRERIVQVLVDSGRRKEAATEALKLAVGARKALLHDRALTALDTAVECNPSLKEALELRVETLLTLGRKTEAVRQLETMADRAADDDTSATLLERAVQIEPKRADLKKRADDIRSGRLRRRRQFWRRLMLTAAVFLLVAALLGGAGWELKARIAYDAVAHSVHLDLVRGQYAEAIRSLRDFAAAHRYTLAARHAGLEAESIREAGIHRLNEQLQGVPEDQKAAIEAKIADLKGR
jgi:tetratricopeptide (TPR) repeat protein